MKDMLYAVLALVFVIGAGIFFYLYVNQADAESASTVPFIGAIACTLATLIFGALFLSGRVNKTEEIHITE